MSKWLEVSLEVDGELAEPVAEVLRRYIPDGVVIESTAIIATREHPEGVAGGPVRVYGYLPVDESLESARQRLEESLWYLGRIRPLPNPSYRAIAEANWAESWKQHFQPIQVGERLIIVPAWLEPPDRERIPIRVDPGMAFGTGTHPTTQLCLEIIESLCVPGKYSEGRALDVIDLGCGTAILAAAALKLGARRALGVDIDPQAVAAALKNSQANGVADRLELGQGSLAEIKAGAFSLKKARIVVANILTHVLVELLEEGLADLLAPGGSLVLSGILEDQADGVLSAARRQGLRLQDQRQVSDWVALVFDRGE